MANTVIQLKKSSTPSAVPGSLEFGELAINYADGKIYYKNTNSQITVFPSTINYFGTVNANSVLVIADTPGDILTIEAGENITIVGDAINDKVTISANIAPAFDKANSANVLAFNTGIGANAFTSATIAGANTAVGTGANTYALSVASTASADALAFAIALG